jgi:hypothetical protein
LAPLRRMHARPTHRIKSKGWDGSVRGKIAKGHFVQGMQHPRILGRGHIGRGWTNIAPNMNPPPPIQLASKFSPQFSKGRTHSPGGKGGGGVNVFWKTSDTSLYSTYNNNTLYTSLCYCNILFLNRGGPMQMESALGSQSK